MTCKENERKAMSLTVTEGLTVTILPDSNHEFLMSTREVANGYGVTSYAIRQTKLRNNSELIDDRHYLSNVTIRHGASPGASKSTMWTRRGIVRLGFFIKSERAKLFRDWAEELIIKLDEQTDLFGSVVKPFAQLPSKRKHNRLTQDRLVSILADVCKIENSQLRLSISNKLMGKEEHE